MKNGKIFLGRPRGGHIDIAQGGDVQYAGQIRFGRGDKTGVIKYWNNESGHYKPDAAFSTQAPLPQSVFKPYKFNQ